MRSILFLSALSILMFSFYSCDPAKQYMKEGNKAYELGNYDAAANYFYNVLLLKPGSTEAKQGLTKTGNSVLSGKFTEFAKYVTANDQERAVKQYLACKKYFDKCKSVGVELDWVTMYDPIFEDIKSEYVGKKYDQGVSLMQSNKFDLAEKIFSEIAEIDSTYKDATVLRTKSIAEPLYIHGKKMMEAGNFRDAYRSFTKIQQIDPLYKDTKLLKEEALNKAIVGVGILPVVNQTRTYGFDVNLYQQIVATLVQNNNPFLKVVDRSALELMLREQELGMSGMVDPESAAKAGKLIGLKYILLTSISDFKYEETGPKTDSLIAYEAYSESYTPPNSNFPQTVTRFKKVKYSDTYQKKKLYYRVFYQLVSAQTSQVVASDVISEEKQTELHSCNYSGNVNMLYPELPSGNFLPPKPVQFREQFNRVNEQMISKEELTQDVCKTISTKMVDDIMFFLDK